MGDEIKTVLEQISAYEILNSMIPGTMYIGLVERLTPFHFFTGLLWVDIIICYFAGVVIGRIGSLYIGEFAKKRNPDKMDYMQYIKAERENERIRQMSAIRNMYRSFISTMICFIISYLFSFVWPYIVGYAWLKSVLIVIGCLMLVLLFQKSYKKQHDFVDGRIQEIITRNVKDTYDNNNQD